MRILHPTDFSSASRVALAKALEIARSNRAQLTIVHVRPVTVPALTDGEVSARAYQQLDRAAEATARKQLAQLVQQAKKRGVRTNGMLVLGRPHEQIIRAARRARADMIVIGTHGRTGLSRLFLGSVASRVVALASCPVLTVRSR